MDIMKGPPLPRFLNIFWPWYKPPLPEPPEAGVGVGLLNPPGEAENWSLFLTDWDMTVAIREVSDKDRLDIGEPATFEIPSGVVFPLRVAALQITKWIEWEGTPALKQLYYVQAMHANQYDWDTGTWTGPPDPTYKEAFIPEYGNYYYNVAAERLERA